MALQRGDGVLKAGRIVAGVLRIGVLLVLLLVTVVLALLMSSPGHNVVRRLAVSALGRAVDGQVRIGSLGGALWQHLDLSDVELDDSAGHPVVRVERISLHYNIFDLLRGAYRFSSVTLVRPIVDLDQGQDGRLNIEHLFRLTGKTDTTKHSARPLVDLRDVAIVQGTVRLTTHSRADTTADRRELDHLTADFARLRLSHPDSTALLADVKRLRADLSNPRLHVQNLDGRISLSGDTIRVDADHVTLPGTRAAIVGQFRLGGKNLALDLAVNASPVTFADVRSIVSVLPDSGGGEVAVMVHLSADGTVEADVRHIDIRTGRTALRGKGIVLLRPDQTGSARGIDVELAPLDLALLDRFVTDLPVRGLVRGSVTGGGRLSDLTFSTKVEWTDEKTEGHPVNTLDGGGRMLITPSSGADFRDFQLRSADVDFGTIRQFAPSLKLAGRLRAAGTLVGPWRSAQFNGALLHYADSNQASAFHGALMIGLGDTTRLDAVLDVDSLSLDLLRRTWPQIPLTGTLRGRATIHGPLDSLDADLDLAGAPGELTAKGMIGLRDSATVLRLTGTFDSLDLNGLRDNNPNSQLSGTWRLDLVSPADSARPATGTARVDLTGVNAAGVALGPGVVAVRLEPDRIAIEEAKLTFNGGGAEATGAIGRGKGASGTLDFAVHADTIGYLEPMLRWFAVAGDSGVVKLDGKGSINGSLTGNTEVWTLTGDASLDGINVGGDFGRALKVHGSLHGDSAGTVVSAEAKADSLAIGSLGYRPVAASVQGRLDSLTVGAEVGFSGSSRLRTLFTTWTEDSTRRTLRIDTLALRLPAHTWQLTAPATVRFGTGRLTMDTLDFRTPSAGFVRLAGTMGRRGTADFFLDADSLPLEDIYATAQLDTTGINGAFSADVRITGEADSPAMVVSVELENGRIGDYTLPRVFVQGDYHEKVMTLSGGLWRDSVRIVSLHGTAPLDLSLTTVRTREIAGPIDIAAQADTLDMRAFNALAKTVTGVSGTMGLNVHVLGTWAAPNLSGYVDITNGAVRVPAIGANYDQIDLRLEAPGDSTVRVARGRLHAGGTLDLAGRLSFNRGLTHPDVAMRLDMAGFNAFDIPNFGSLTATGRDSLGGPLFGATLTGTLVADKGTLQFANLVEKRIVSLDDPEFRAMVDSNLAGADLAPSSNTIFFDSLRIDRLAVTMGRDVWLRSSEANIQLDGDIVVSRSFEDNIPRYRIDGTLRALRGNYKLALGNGVAAVTRDFRVTKGEVRFFGTPDFNPEMDVVAEYVARSEQGSPLTVKANIEGTLLYPRLRLSSDAQPPLTETEIASYLLFGRSGAPELGASGFNSQAQVIGGSVLSGVGQALVSELGLPINYLTITPGTGRTSSAGGASSARLEAGAQLNDRTFLTLNAGLCEVLTSKLVGVTLEYRLSSIWSASAAFEPVIQQCGTVATLANLKNIYQLGFDLFWQQGVR